MQKMRDNIEAIRTAFALIVERRPPDDAEWEILSKYAGFGGLKCILNDANELADAAKWAKSDRELFAPTVELRRIIHDHSKDDRQFKRYMDSLKASVLPPTIPLSTLLKPYPRLCNRREWNLNASSTPARGAVPLWTLSHG